MTPRQILIVLGLAVAGFGAAFAIGSASGGAEPAAAEKQPGAADVIEVAGAQVAATAPAGGDLPTLRLPEKKKAPVAPTTSSGSGTVVAPADTGTTAAPVAEPVAPTVNTTPVQPDPAPSTNSGGDTGGGFIEIGGED